jgi:hypothetical protein
MSVGFSVWIMKYTPHCNKTVEVTTLQKTVVCSILTPDCEARIRYHSCYQESVFNGLIDLGLTFYSDEAWFALSGYVNSQNKRLIHSKSSRCP